MVAVRPAPSRSPARGGVPQAPAGTSGGVGGPLVAKRPARPARESAGEVARRDAASAPAGRTPSTEPAVSGRESPASAGAVDAVVRPRTSPLPASVLEGIANARGIVVAEPVDDDPVDVDRDDVDGGTASPDVAEVYEAPPGTGSVAEAEASAEGYSLEVDPLAYGELPHDAYGRVGSWAIPPGDGAWSFDDEVVAEGDGLTTSERDPAKLWRVKDAVRRFFPGASLESVSRHRLASAADFQSYWLTGPSDADALLASQINRIWWRIEQSRHDGDFGSFPAAWEDPGYELDPETVLSERREWRDPQDWVREPAPMDVVLQKQRAAVLARKAAAEAEAAAAAREVGMLSAALDGTFLNGSASFGPGVGEFDHYVSSLGRPWVGGDRGENEFAPAGDATTSLAREALVERVSGTFPPDRGVLSALLDAATREMRLSQAEVVFLAWLSESEDPIGLLSACHYDGSRPWHAVLSAAGFADCLPKGRRGGAALPVEKAQEKYVEDVVARLLAPDGGALINRLEGAMERFDALRSQPLRVNPEASESRDAPIRVEVASRAPAVVPRAEVAGALSDCAPAFGSASHPDFQVPVGSCVVAIPGEPAYLLGEGWACGPDGRLWTGSDPGVGAERHLPIVSNGRGARVAYHRGKRWIRDVDVHRDESAGERLWRMIRLQEVRMDALNSGLAFGDEAFEAAFAAGSHPLDRGMAHGSLLRVDRLWLSAWPFATRMLPVGAMYGLGDAAIWRPNAMALLDERRSVWNPGASMGRRAQVAVRAAARLAHGVGAWSRSAQNRGMQERRFLAHVLDFADFMGNAALCAATGTPREVFNDLGSEWQLERDFASAGFGGDALAPGSAAEADSQVLLEEIRAAADAVRGLAAEGDGELASHVAAVDAAYRKWLESVSEPVGPRKAAVLGCDPSDSVLDARMAVEREMSAERLAHAKAMGEAGARLVHFPDPSLEGAAPILSVPWSGTFRPLAGRGEACLRAEVTAASGPWSSRAFSPSQIGFDDPANHRPAFAQDIRASLKGFVREKADFAFKLHKDVMNVDFDLLHAHEKSHVALHDQAIR